MAGRKTIEYYSGGGFGDRVTPLESDTQSGIFRAHKGQVFLAGVAKSFVDGIAAIQSQYKDNLHPAKIAELANKCLQELPKGIAQFLKPVEQNFNSARSRVNALCRQSSSDAVSAVRRMELRTHLKSLDHKDRVEIFQQAVKDNDDDIVSAFLESNRLFKLIEDKQILADGQRQWLCKKDPELEIQYFDTERAGSILARNFANIARDLMFYASMPPAEIAAIVDNIPKPGWNHELSPDAKMIESGAMPSRLPAPTMTMAK